MARGQAWRSLPDAGDADRIAERIFVGTQVLVAAVGLVASSHPFRRWPAERGEHSGLGEGGQVCWRLAAAFEAPLVFAVAQPAAHGT